MTWHIFFIKYILHYKIFLMEKLMKEKDIENLCRLKDMFKTIYHFEHELKERFTLSINEAIILCTLTKDEATSGDLAKEIGLSPGRISKILGNLENRNLVLRQIGRKDKRTMHFSITPEGKKKISQVKSSNIAIPSFTMK